MPALLTSTSMPPSSFAASATMRSICARSPTLQMPIFNPLISVAADFNASALMSHVYTSAPERMNAAAMCFPIPEAPAVTRTLRDMGNLQNSRVEPVDALTDAIHLDCAIGPTDADKGQDPVHSRATQHHAQRINSLCRGAIFFGLQIVPNLRYRRWHQCGQRRCILHLRSRDHNAMRRAE